MDEIVVPSASSSDTVGNDEELAESKANEALVDNTIMGGNRTNETHHNSRTAVNPSSAEETFYGGDNSTVNNNESQQHESVERTGIAISTSITKTMSNVPGDSISTSATTTIDIVTQEQSSQTITTGSEEVSVKTNTIIITIKASSGSFSKSIKVDHLELKSLISNGGNIGVDQILALW